MNNSFEIRILLLLFVLAGIAPASAQQEAMTTQYVVNKLFINPAYAGYKENPTFVLTQRNQWIGFKGAPHTSLLSFDSPLKKGEIAVGGSLLYDKVGPASRMGLSGDIAYRFRLSNRATLSLGLKASFELYQATLTDLSLTSQYYGTMDDAFMFNTKGVLLPNVGFGVYYFNKNQFVGLSLPRMIPNKLEKRGTEQYTFLNGRQVPTFNFMAGRLIKINKQVKLQPNIIVRGVYAAPISLGLYCNTILMDQATVGLFYHVGENLGLLAQWQLDRQLRIGYSVDFPLNSLIRTSLGSHEVMVQYAMQTKKKRIVYPRYF
jgi:type IX secretion system PorP/SprF family membrane protein